MSIRSKRKTGSQTASARFLQSSARSRHSWARVPIKIERGNREKLSRRNQFALSKNSCRLSAWRKTRRRWASKRPGPRRASLATLPGQATGGRVALPPRPRTCDNAPAKCLIAPCGYLARRTRPKRDRLRDMRDIAKCPASWMDGSAPWSAVRSLKDVHCSTSR